MQQPFGFGFDSLRKIIGIIIIIIIGKIIGIIYRLPPLPPTHLAFGESMFGYSLHWFPRSALLVRLLEDLSL